LTREQAANDRLRLQRPKRNLENAVVNSSADRLKELTEAWIEKGWQDGDPGVVDQLHDPEFVDHDCAGRRPDNGGFKQGILELFLAFPDLKAEVDGMVVDEEEQTVAVRWSAVGTHRGEYLGAKPTNKQIRFKGIEIIRYRRNRIIERWGEWDGINLLSQLGVISL